MAHLPVFTGDVEKPRPEVVFPDAEVMRRDASAGIASRESRVGSQVFFTPQSPGLGVPPTASHGDSFYSPLAATVPSRTNSHRAPLSAGPDVPLPGMASRTNSYWSPIPTSPGVGEPATSSTDTHWSPTPQSAGLVFAPAPASRKNSDNVQEEHPRSSPLSTTRGRLRVSRSASPVDQRPVVTASAEAKHIVRQEVRTDAFTLPDTYDDAVFVDQKPHAPEEDRLEHLREASHGSGVVGNAIAPTLVPLVSSADTEGSQQAASAHASSRAVSTGPAPLPSSMPHNDDVTEAVPLVPSSAHQPFVQPAPPRSSSRNPNPFEDSNYIMTPEDNRGFLTPPSSVPPREEHVNVTSHGGSSPPPFDDVSRSRGPSPFDDAAASSGRSAFSGADHDDAPIAPLGHEYHGPAEGNDKEHVLVKTDDGPGPPDCIGGVGSPEHRNQNTAPPALEYHPRNPARAHPAAPPLFPPPAGGLQTAYVPIEDVPNTFATGGVDSAGSVGTRNVAADPALPTIDQSVQTSYHSPPVQTASAAQQTSGLVPGAYRRHASTLNGRVRKRSPKFRPGEDPPSEPNPEAMPPAMPVVQGPSERLALARQTSYRDAQKVAPTPPRLVYPEDEAGSPPTARAEAAETGRSPSCSSIRTTISDIPRVSSIQSHSHSKEARRVAPEETRYIPGYVPSALPPPSRKEVAEITERLRAGNLLSGRPLAGSPHRVRPKEPANPQAPKEPVSKPLPLPPLQVVDDVADLLRRARVIGPDSPQKRQSH
eukprot:TRINITY_DN23295_c0_g1_i1.p1 TRINITY_DN23295_c0_g1~~TRINITY_DN23295_c0_g1_i1.p1  ORF type:complete len:762 (+),score=51.03 TRINITY_DN23295_c0_g1_i1:75-2360(+)